MSSQDGRQRRVVVAAASAFAASSCSYVCGRLTFEFIVRFDLLLMDVIAAAAARLVNVVGAVEPWDPTELLLLLATS